MSVPAFGILSDISVGGAQFLARLSFEPGSCMLLRIGFDPDPPFSTSADVMWIRGESDAKRESSFAHGVRFRIEDPDRPRRPL